VRLIKMFGLAMIAAIAAMAFAGTGSASAAGSILCDLGPTDGVCPAGELLVANNTAFLGEGLGKDKFVSGFANVECEGHMEGKVTNHGSSTEYALGSIEKVTWKNCSVNAAPCLFLGGTASVSAQALALPWHFTILGTATLSIGEMHITNVEGLFLITCNNGTKFHCIYKASTVLPETLNHTAIANTQIHANKLPLARVTLDPSCSATGEWTGLYDLNKAWSVHAR
jgi:hypothetical protein